MQAISVRQPYAWAIARGHRRISNQESPTDYRGTVLVHAAMRVDLDSCVLPQVRAAGWDPNDPLAALGAAIAVVELTEVCGATVGRKDAGCDCGVWAQPGEYHWKLSDLRPLRRPIMALGRQGGLWTPQDSLVADVKAMMIEPPPREVLLLNRT